MVLFYTEQNKYKSSILYYLGMYRFLRNESETFKNCNVVVFVDEYALNQPEIQKIITKSIA